MKKANNMFDLMANDYYSFSPSIPEEYIKLIENTFLLKKKDKIIDLGCGSGELALGLTTYTAFVEGLDISKKMIDLAKKNDKNKKATWINSEIENMTLEKKSYKLIISHESFHLFQHKKNIIKKCMDALKPNGALCIGWATYEWEDLLRDTIIETLSHYESSWDNMWTYPKFAQIITEEYKNRYTIEEKKISIQTENSLENIVHYLFSISQTYALKKRQKEELFNKLLTKFKQIYPSGKSQGETTYTIKYAYKKKKKPKFHSPE